MSDETRPTALIIGGSGGIGRAVAERLGQEGYRLALASRSTERLGAATVELQANGCEVESFPTDITDEESVQALVESVRNRFGRIDVLVNAAGIAEPGFFARASLDHWEGVLRTNLLGVVTCCKAVLPVMKRQKSGHMITVGSFASEDGRAGFAAYSASKAGLMAMANSLRREAGRFGIKIATIAPEEVATAMHGADNPEAEQMIQPADVAETVAYLLRLSPTASVTEVLMQRTGTVTEKR